MKKDIKIIANKYIKEKTLGSGGEGVAYLVIDKDTNEKLVAKTMEQEGGREKKYYKEDKEFERKIEETKRMFYKIRSIDSPYIIRCITEGFGEIKKNNEFYKKRQYFIFEYASNGDLWKPIKGTQSGFEELCCKILFKKILLGVQALHKAGIFHRDLKIDNIVIDENYNPKICDFGFATDKTGKLIDTCGTKQYKAPQKHEELEYSGEKADIFSLGCILFDLAVGGECFINKAVKTDESYKYVYEKNEAQYFEKLAAKYNIINTLKDEFKHLHFKMIAYEEGDRPNNIGEILKDKWFDELDNLSEEKQKDLLEKRFDDKKKLIDLYLTIIHISSQISF